MKDVQKLVLGMFSPVWGYIPFFLQAYDPSPTTEQLDKRYVDGWRPFSGFTLDKTTMVLTYPEDEPLKPRAIARFRADVLAIYESAWVCVLHPDGSYEVSRMD